MRRHSTAPRLVAALGLASWMLFYGSLARAEEPIELSMAAVVDRARAYAPLALGGGLEPRLAEAALIDASAPFSANPELELSAGPRFSAHDETGLDLSVGLSQPLELGGKQRSRREVARAGIERARAEDARAVEAYIAEAATLFVQTLYARERAALAHRDTELAAELVTIAQNRVEAGESGQIEVSLADVAHRRMAIRAQSLEARADAHLGALRAMLGIEAGAPVALATRLGQVQAEPLEALLARAAGHPELRELEATLEHARRELDLAASGRWPDARLALAYGREGQEQLATAGVSLTLPLFVSGRGLAHAARARHEITERQLQTRHRMRRDRIVAQYERLQSLQRARDAFERDVLVRLEGDEALLADAYADGAIGLTEVLAARREIAGARETFVELQFEMTLAALDLEERAGFGLRTEHARNPR